MTIATAVRRAFGGHSMVAPLRRVVVRRPDRWYAVEDPGRWHYRSTPDFAAAQREHDLFVQLLTDCGAEVIVHDTVLPELADSVFVHDPAWVTDGGTLVLRMGKRLRWGEEEALGRCLESAGVPILAGLSAGARAEGGDLLWLEQDLLAVGQGFRTNREGLDAVASAVADLGVEVMPIDLPVAGGADACLHLQSLISLVDLQIALVYQPLLAVTLYRRLLDRGYRLVEVPDEEVASLGANVLTLQPGLCVALDGNPVTRRRLEKAGVEVRVFPGRELCLKTEGGPSCLSRPVLREC